MKTINELEYEIEEIKNQIKINKESAKENLIKGYCKKIIWRKLTRNI